MAENSNRSEPRPITVQPVPSNNPLSPPVADAKRKPPQQSCVSVIGPRMVLKGELTAGDDMVIHGMVEGRIAHRSQHVVVAAEGTVRALVHARSIIVEGTVLGDIHGEEYVELRAGAKVDGDVYCSELRIASGARLNGTVHMS